MSRFKDESTVTHFGLWHDETASSRERGMALLVLRDAYEGCVDDDMRTREVREALDFLKAATARPGVVERFWKALGVENPVERKEAVRRAYNGIAKVL